MKIILSDNGLHLRFAPLTLTRPLGNLRMGIFTNDERWKKLIPTAEVFYQTESYLSGKYPTSSQGVLINAAIIPNQEVANAVLNLQEDEMLTFGDTWIAKKGSKSVEFQGESPIILSSRWDLFQQNGKAIEQDFELVSKGKTSHQLSSSNTVIGDTSRIFVEEGVKAEAVIFNTTSGAIYLGKNVEIMEGSIVRGGLAMLENSTLKMGAKIYGPTTIGAHCKVGGEVSNSIFYAYSNKGHDGFLGNSIIGEWCNLGADTNSSNLKNNYGLVKAYSFESKSIEATGIQFMGLTMGDHSKSGINTMFNTATVVGVSTNVFGAEFPSKFLNSFTWGVGKDEYTFEKAIESANNMMKRRNLELSSDEIAILKYIADNK